MVDLTRLGRLAVLGTLCAAAVGATAQPGAATISPDLYSGLTWRCVGPFDGGPVASVVGVPGEAGVYVITTPGGGAWKTSDGGGTWTPIDRPHDAPASTDPHRWIDPDNPRRIVRTDAQGIAVSLDGGTSWVASHNLPIAEVAHLTPHSTKVEMHGSPRHIDNAPANVSIADPARPGLIFAGTNESVFVSFDGGGNWQSLRLNLPHVAINDLDIRGDTLVAATQGRSVWELDDISPLRQLTADSASAPAILFKPADAVLNDRQTPSAGTPAASVNLDYYLASRASGEVRLEVLDAGGRVVHAASSVIPGATDRWLAVTRPLSSAPGQHRVAWNLRLDPPPAQKHQYSHLARTLFEDMPADPKGPRVLAGTYRVTLTVAGQVYSQPLIVQRAGQTPATLAADQRQFDLAIKMYDAMQIAHQGFLQLARVRAQLHPLLASADSDLAQLATSLDAQLADLDGSAWTGLVVPDADAAEEGEEDAKEGKHPDFVPPAPVSISKDYDDPTTILGRQFDNVSHPPAFATMNATLGDMLTKTVDADVPPDAASAAEYDRSCRDLSGVLDAWTAINAQDLPQMNAELAARNLPPLPIATNLPALACGVR